ncbi:hypothetical protein MKX08_004006 [Trichoderma sp. CBMAI-0020]|nr:hypothetical protein MKX08_004006 [Trichoderma sp. CBMAI-0020]
MESEPGYREAVEPHIRIQPQCGACGQLFRPRECPIISITRKGASLEITNAFMFSGYGHSNENSYRRACGKEEVFCKNMYCVSCRKTDDSITVHADCFHLFTQRCAVKDAGSETARKKEVYRRLWLAGRKRYAWRGMVPLKFMSSATLERCPPEMISEICGFGRVLLPEMALLIQSHSREHILWRFCSVLQLLRDLELAQTLETATYPLPKVLSWSRGEAPKLVEDQSLAGPLVALTIDARGLKSIQRISEPSRITGSEVPSPSLVSEWVISTLDPDLVTSSTLNIIGLDPSCCTGISFFLHNHNMIDVHAHCHSTRHLPTHVEKFKYREALYPDGRGSGVEWIYMPLTARDAITAFRPRRGGDYRSPFYQFYTQAGETIAVGTPFEEQVLPARVGPDEVYTLGKDDDAQHLSLVCEMLPFVVTDVVRVDAGLATDADADGRYAAMVIDNPPTMASLGATDHTASRPWKAFFSSASLEGILDVHVFTVSWRKLCKGILIEYENGSKRALGQCRLGLDDVQSWHRPLSMHYVPVEYERNVSDLVRETRTSKSAQVTFDCESGHVTEDGSLEENYYELKGRLNFWFSYTEVLLQFVD